MTTRKPEKILIIGAGPAGLVAGLKLAEQGIDVEILESEERVGGLCATLPFLGCNFDLGGHRFVTKDADVQQFLAQLMGDELILRPRKSVILLKGKTLRYPVQAADVVRKLGIGFSLNAFVDYALTSMLQKIFPRPDSSFEQWIVNRFGTTLYNLYFGPYSEKLWGIKPCGISHRWAAQRIPLLNMWDVVSRMLWGRRDTPTTYAHQFYYPRKGIGQISDILAEKIVALGGTVRLNAPVTEVSLSGDIISEVAYRGTSGELRHASGDYIINTSPLPRFIRMCTPAPDNVDGITRRSDYRGIRFLHVVLDRKPVSDNTWIYVPESRYPFFRIQELRNWSPTIVAEGKTALTLEIACNHDDEMWSLPDDRLWDLCFEGLKELGLLKDNTVDGYFTSYARHGYPIYYLDYEENVVRLYEYINRIHNLRSIGRQGLFRYNNMDHSIKMGLLTAEHFLNEYPFSQVMAIATENKIFDWQDPGK